MATRTGTSILWFRQDLRLHDHPALLAAIEAAPDLVLVYVLDDDPATDLLARGLGGASRWWLHHSLASLAAEIATKGGTLTLRRGPAAATVAALAEETGAHTVFTGLAHEPAWRDADAALRTLLEKSGRKLVQPRVATLVDLDQVRTGSGGTYGMYTPFANNVRARGNPPEPSPAPETLHTPGAPRSDRLEDWALLPTKPDWAGGLREMWQPGEAGGRSRLAKFLKAAVRSYKTGRNLPGEEGTSMLSPYLHWGEISPNTIWHACRLLPGDDVQIYLNELIWRDFGAYLLWHHPHLPDAPLRPEFGRIAWRDDPATLHAWQRGRTGVPIVDAGMRQLWHTGWMHNRVRMIVASYLVKHLLISWQTGTAFFMDTLVDADLASNSANWQWIAGSGIDSQPFFRIFNPVTQGEKFDPAGVYVRRWVPELAQLAENFVHAPWKAPKSVLASLDYPAPLISLGDGRNRALAVYRQALGRETGADNSAPAHASPS